MTKERIFAKWVDPNAPVLVLLGALLLGILGAGLYDLLKEWLGVRQVVLVLALIFLLLSFLLSRVSSEGLSRWLLQSLKLKGRPSVTIEQVRKVERRRQALIAISSPGSNKATDPIIKFHYRGEHGDEEQVLRYCWLIAGPGKEDDPNSSIANAQAIEDSYKPAVEVKIKPILDAENPQLVFDTVQEIYREARDLGLSNSQIIADYTGGTKSMTAGLVLACTDQDRDLQYMKPRRYTADGRADYKAGSDPIIVDTNFFVEFGQEPTPPPTEDSAT